jgi:hypothetical protein
MVYIILYEGYYLLAAVNKNTNAVLLARPRYVPVNASLHVKTRGRKLGKKKEEEE